jgi:hypothetical protein
MVFVAIGRGDSGLLWDYLKMPGFLSALGADSSDLRAWYTEHGAQSATVTQWLCAKSDHVAMCSLRGYAHPIARLATAASLLNSLCMPCPARLDGDR